MSTSVQTPARDEEQASLLRRVLLPTIFILLGVIGLMYPIVATQWNNSQQAKVAEQYESDVAGADPHTLNEQVEKARLYNDEKAGGPILDPWLSRISEDNTEYQEYLAQLSGLRAMSQVAIPSIDSRLPVYHGTRENTLQHGLGHLYGTSLPVGGPGSHAVITGHTGLTNATLWDNLSKVVVGDAVYVSTFGEQMKYEVDKIDVVLPEDVDSLRAVPGEDRLTLITCTPYGVNTHRLLVHAHRVPMDPADTGALTDSGTIFQWWMLILLIPALLGAWRLIWWINKERRENSNA
ncbi:class C sortase [Corynebacterium aquatimens]|uniref:Sortase A n=1 Tax=Corynebacterium aquatimens TaxID=1190508 RepID=A0A931E3G9_9CORY|nr:class C sortase [Corynebacterium aquatimens]MBG6122935.1 sortase A [Corynebacterium aquatimens]